MPHGDPTKPMPPAARSYRDRRRIHEAFNKFPTNWMGWIRRFWWGWPESDPRARARKRHHRL